jgi:hypothetical protein
MPEAVCEEEFLKEYADKIFCRENMDLMQGI